jgi:hypothetical protein
VIGLVRDKATTDKKIAEDADLKGRTNIHIFEADVKDYPALKVRGFSSSPSFCDCSHVFRI